MGLSDLFAVSDGSINVSYTFRLDHRNMQGSALQQFPGEERLLIFRSDRAGAIAKIIYSFDNHDETAQAKIHCLECKEAYRGHDFGGLLFTEAVNSLRNKYTHDSSPISARIHCQLDAEEDERRHHKLVEFYEQLGCSVKESAKVRFMHNNDGETYRKIPMFMSITEDQAQPYFQTHSLDRFVPVNLLKGNGQRVHVNSESDENTINTHNRRLDHWLLLQDDDNYIEFRTTIGACLHVDGSGVCDLLWNGSNQQCHKFQLLRVANDFDNDPRCCKDTKSLWMIRSVEHMTFLAVSAGHSAFLQLQTTPAFWQVGPSYSLIQTTDTPAQRRHYWLQWETQCVAYVMKMKERYLKFNTRRLNLQEALDCVQSVTADPWSAGETISGSNRGRVSLRTLCFRTAERFRSVGHPDWIQLLALVYGLGSVLKDDTDAYDWTVCSRSRVLGCPVPNEVAFGEFRSINPDDGNPMYSAAATGMYEQHCGLSKVLLTWTGPEYMYHMLQHNKVDFPEEGLTMLRLASLSDWHTSTSQDRKSRAYVEVCGDDDYTLQSLVADFDDALQAARSESLLGNELTDADCESLWTSHYADIAAKYNAAKQLEW
jgi:Myo-inositol oxygenase